jgi:hypothetical protein
MVYRDDARSCLRFRDPRSSMKSGIPAHASRQMLHGRWTSKLGRSVLIEHDFDALDGGSYGQIEGNEKTKRNTWVALC